MRALVAADKHVTDKAENRTTLTSYSEQNSRHLGKCLGEKIESPLVIALHGKLGAGKTCFVQGIARGLGVSDEYYITSPSYTLVNTYPGRLLLNHLDLYRLKEMSDFDDIGLDEILTSESVSVIEWAERLASDMPATRLDIFIDIVGEQTRCFTLHPFGKEAKKVLRAFLSTDYKLEHKP